MTAPATAASAGAVPPSRRFEAKTAFVTGAGSGIGRATAVRLAVEGAAVACLDVSEQSLEQTLEIIGSAGGSAMARRCDITSEPDAVDSVAWATSSMGRPDVLCNVAGTGTFAHTVEMSLSDWDRIIGVNLTGTFIMTKAVLPHMLEAGAGSIVNVASTAALIGSAYSAAYCASKGGVLMLTKALAVEYADRNIRVNAVAPGGVDTPLIANFGLPEGGDPKHFTRIMSRMGFSTPEQIAAAIVFLASEESSYTTGALLAVDGGVTA